MDDYGIEFYAKPAWNIANYGRTIGWLTFILSFSAAYFVFRLENDDNVSFYYYVNYAVPMKMYDISKEYWRQFDSRYLGFLNVEGINEQHQLNRYLDQQKEALFASQQRQQARDQEATRLRQQLAAVDKQLG